MRDMLSFVVDLTLNAESNSLRYCNSSGIERGCNADMVVVVVLFVL